MIFNFPKPRIAKPYMLDLSVENAASIKEIATVKKITEEDVVSTMVEAALTEYKRLNGMDISKKCSKCGIEKPLNIDNFHLNKSRPDGFSHTCKACRVEKERAGVNVSSHQSHVNNMSTPEVSNVNKAQEVEPVSVTSKRRCHTCKVEKDLNTENFNLNKINKDGYQDKCRQCQAAYMKEYFAKRKAEKNPEAKAIQDSADITRERYLSGKLVSSQLQKIRNNSSTEDERISEMVVVCGRDGCDRKYVKGTGVIWKNIECCRNLCAEKLIDVAPSII